ncbi:MAG TPA: hypothetical protein VMM58_03970 [Bacteroidota bacterium]|nr:hypothetical protein [Bacteroidota bacterium]
MKHSIFLIGIFFLIPFKTSAQFLSTRIITGEGVYIFGPSVAEADSLSLDEGEALSDFSYYSTRIAAFVRAKGLPCEYVSDRTIRVRFGSNQSFTVSRDSVEFGTILTNGKDKPWLLKYVVTDDQLKEECKEFFGLK